MWLLYRPSSDPLYTQGRRPSSGVRPKGAREPRPSVFYFPMSTNSGMTLHTFRNPSRIDEK